jgi:hypothetical protein
MCLGMVVTIHILALISACLAKDLMWSRLVADVDYASPQDYSQAQVHKPLITISRRARQSLITGELLRLFVERKTKLLSGFPEYNLGRAMKHTLLGEMADARESLLPIGEGPN